MNKKELLEKIDNLPIYKKDREVIFELMNSVSPEMFTKILEEVIDGELFWSDFETFLANTDYPRQLRESLENQKQMENYLRKLIDFRRKVGAPLLLESKTNLIAMVDGGTKDASTYSNEAKKYKENLLYELTKPNVNDTPLAAAVKIRLYNAIKNGKILENNPNPTGYTVFDDKIIKNDDGDAIFEYINPDDIFYFISDYYAPIAYKFQMLDSFDREFMEKNNLNEKQMKQFKSLSILFQRNQELEGGSNE